MEKRLHREILEDSIFIIGSVHSVEGRVVKIEVKKDKNDSYILYDGTLIKNVSVGSYVKIVKGFTKIIGIVEGEYITEDGYNKSNYGNSRDLIKRFLNIALLGHFEEGVFVQGIKEMPLIKNECFILNAEEFQALHSFKNAREYIDIGTLSDDEQQRVKLPLSIFTSHVGIFGNTGSGKSNTLTRLYTELFKTGAQYSGFNKSDFVVIDFSGEYVGDKVFMEGKDIFALQARDSLNVNKYPITKDELNDLEILSVLFDATEKTQKPFLRRALANTYFDTSDDFSDKVKINVKSLIDRVISSSNSDLSVNFVADIVTYFGVYAEALSETDIETVSQLANEIREKLEFHGQENNTFYWKSSTREYANDVDIVKKYIMPTFEGMNFIDTPFNRLKVRIISKFFHEQIFGDIRSEFIGPMIHRMFDRISKLEKVIDVTDESIHNANLSIVCLKDIEDLSLKKVLPLMICRKLYKHQKSINLDGNRSLHIIIDEAHNILSEISERESQSWKDYRLETFEEIIKEGRKYGVFLTIASQRPQDIAPTIISQLHNYFIHRLINDKDINSVQKAVSYLDRNSFESIPLLSAGNCFVAGLATNIPLKVAIELYEDKAMRPKSDTVDLVDMWTANVNE